MQQIADAEEDTKEGLALVWKVAERGGRIFTKCDRWLMSSEQAVIDKLI